MVPYADFNLLKFPDRDQAMAKIRDLTMLSDIFPTGYHGAVHGRRDHRVHRVRGRRRTGRPGVRGLRHLLGAAVVIVGDMIPERLAQAASFGCETVDVAQGRPAGRPDRADPGRARSGLPPWIAWASRPRATAKGAERGAGHGAELVMTITRAGGALGIPGLYVTGDPGADRRNAKVGQLGIRIGLGWAKSHAFTTGQCPVMRYNRQLMMAILHDKMQIAKAVNATVITLDEAPKGYQDFDQGAAKKFVIDPHGMIAKSSASARNRLGALIAPEDGAMPSFGRAPSQCSSRPSAPRLQLGEQPWPRRVDVLASPASSADLDRPCPRVTEAQLEMRRVVHQRGARESGSPGASRSTSDMCQVWSANAARVTGSVATRSAMIAAGSTVSCRTAARAWIAPDRAPEDVRRDAVPAVSHRGH